jgi:hypothetical protein
MIGRIKKGEVIKASFLNDMAQGIDTLNETFVDRPRQVLDSDPAEVQNEAAEEGIEEADPNRYIETGRTSSTVQVFDQNDENYAEVSRIELVTFENALGETITLEFNNSG